jgi:hypothetical protein
MTTAAALRFRIQEPNARARATSVIALDPASEPFVARLAEDRWNHATFLKSPEDVAAARPGADEGWLTTFDGRRIRIREAVDSADAAALIGRACSDRRVTTTALIVGAADAADADISKTLAQLRPWSLMVVIASSDDYVRDMMTALRV